MIRALGQRARRDLQRGIESGRFTVADADVAFFDTAGALLLVMRAVLDGELGADADIHHAEGVLRTLGLTAKQAAEIAHRPPPKPEAINPHRTGDPSKMNALPEVNVLAAAYEPHACWGRESNTMGEAR
jgi:hypothetical protein